MTDTRVLVATANLSARRDIAQALIREGFAPLLANDGRTVLRLAVRTDIAAMIIAQDLPGHDGASICHRLRDAGKQVPVVLTGGADHPRLREASVDAGADDYMVLPLMLPELGARVRSLVSPGHRAPGW